MKKRILSVLACLLILIGSLPVSVLAEGSTAITEVVMTGVSGPAVLAGGARLSVDTSRMKDASGEGRFSVAGVTMLKSSDNGEEDPYEETEDTVIEAGMYYGAIITLEPAEGYHFSKEIDALELHSGSDDSGEEVKYSALLVTDNAISFRLYFGQAEGTVQDVGRIDLYVTDAVYGQAPVQPEATAGAGYSVTYSAWAGNFDEAGNYLPGETYVLPIMVRAVEGYILGSGTEIYVNGSCLFAKSENHNETSVSLNYLSTTEALPVMYQITLQPQEGGTLSALAEDGSVVTQALASQVIRVVATAQEGYEAESAYAYLTDAPDQAVAVNYIGADEASVHYSLTMPQGNVTIGATFKAQEIPELPKAETPQATFAATGATTGILADVDASMKWSLDGTNYEPITDNMFPLTGLSAGNLYIVRSGDNVTLADSDPQVIVIEKEAAPEGLTATNCTTEENNDGTITGIDPALEWKEVSADEYTVVGTDTLTGLVPGTYEFRRPFHDAVLASDKVSVTILAYEEEAPEEYAITITGGSAYVNEEKVTAAAEGAEVTIIAEESDTQVFTGWTVEPETVALADPTSAETTFVMPAEAVTITAVFEEAEDKGYEYTVHYDGNGADSGEMEDQVFYEKEEQTLNLNQFAREGYTFSGWASDAEGPVILEDGMRILKPLAGEGETYTLYAIWKEIAPEYTIAMAGGGAYVDGKKVGTAPEGVTVTIIADEIEGRTFIRWNTNYNESFKLEDPESAETTFVMPAENVTIVAEFDDSDRGYSYLVEFDGNGADAGEMEDQTFYEKEEQKLSLNRYTREGYIFKGWSRSNSGDAEYEDGETIKEPLAERNHVRTLYAVWEDEKKEEPETQPTSVTPTQPTQPSSQPTQPTQPTPGTTAPTAHQESWTSPTIAPTSEQETVPVVINTTEEETEVETPAEQTEEMDERDTTAPSSSAEPSGTESTEKEEQAVKRIRLVLGIAIGVVAAAIAVAVIFYQREKKRHGHLL